MTEKGGNRWGRAVETGRDEFGWAGRSLADSRSGLGLGAFLSKVGPSPDSLGEASTLGGDQVVGGKVGRAGEGGALLREREGV